MKLVAGPNVYCSFADKVLARYQARAKDQSVPPNAPFSVWSDKAQRMIRITVHPADGATFTTDAGGSITWSPSDL